MPATQAWKIIQLGPPNKTLTLQGYNAPFGRPRKGSVVDTEFELRESETYYSFRRKPSRHIFGDKESPMILHGRWMDSAISGPGSAIAFGRYVKQMVADKVRVSVAWGTTASYVGLMTKLRIGRESPAEIVWELTIKVDADVDLVRESAFLNAMITPISQATQIDAAFKNYVATVEDDPISLDLNPSFLDMLRGLVSAANQAAAALLAAADAAQDYTAATAQQLARLRGAVSQFQTAIANMQDTIDTADIDAITFVRSANTDTRWIAYKAESDLQGGDIRALLADMDREVQLAQRGRGTSSYMATLFDTWESISTAVFGTADGAQAIRDANGVRFGQKPVAGQSYLIPASFQ